MGGSSGLTEREVACPVRPWLQVALGKARSFEAIQGDIGLRDEVDRRLGKIATPESRSPPEFSRKNSIHGTGVGEKDDVGHDIGLGKLKGIRLVRRHPERADAITRDARSAWPVCKAPNSYAPYSDRR
jgi:hypothetical protein